MDNLHQKDDIELQAMTEDTKDVVVDISTNVGIHNEGFADEDQDNDISLSITSNGYHNKRIRDRTASGSLNYLRSSRLLEHSIFLDFNDDETDVKVAPKLLQLQFPCADEGHCNDVAEVIRHKLNSIDYKNKGPIDAFALIYQSGLARQLSWQAQVEEAVRGESDEFWQQVAQKTQNMQINRTDAIFEVYTDHIIKKKQNCDRALLWIFSQAISEFSAELFVTRLLQRGANTSTTDKDLNTPLHYAAEKGWTSIVKKLMEHQSIPVVTNKDGLMPLELAIRNNRNDCATFLVKSMEPVRVRNLFEGNEENTCRLSFHSLLENPHMQSTVLGVLDTMIQSLEGAPDSYIVYYNVLDGDQNGRAPTCPNFDASEKSCLHKIAKNNNKEVVYHKVVRLLLRRKWNEFARFRFMNQFAFFLAHTAIMTLALVLAARKPDPLDYNEGIDIFRGMCEVVLILFVTYNVFREGYQFKKNFRQHKLQYFTDFFNYLDSGAIIFTLLIIPFRMTSLPTQWIFASLGYLCQTLRGFEFAAVFRSTGSYVQILSRILIRDMIPFGAIFGLFLFTFTGAFYFALRGEEFATSVNTNNCSSEIDESCVHNVTTGESSSLDVFPHLTKEYYHVLFTNLRVMIESEDVIDQYFGPNGFKWLSVIIYTVFLFLVITVLLNLLIAQMSDTYTNVQSDAQRSLFINRAWIVARAEHNSLFISAFLDCRKRKYTKCEIIENPHDLLEKWEAPPINQVTKELVKLRRLINQHEAANEQLHKEIQLMIQEKESAHENFRTKVLEAMNEQKQLIHMLISNQENESEA